MTIDINAIISAAIAAEVNSNLTDLKQSYANNIGAMAEIIAKLDTRIGNLELANNTLAARLNDLQPTPPIDEVPSDWFARDALTNQFIEKLDTQEWFWDKLGRFIDERIERVHGEPITAESFPELFATQWQRKVGANDLLGRDEVAEVVKELWSEDYEQDVQDMIDRGIEDHDFEDQIRSALRNASISIDI
jgi:hypothetical protein